MTCKARKSFIPYLVFLFFSPAFFPALFPADSLAFGPHGKLECAACHAVHPLKNGIRLAAALHERVAGRAAGYVFAGVRGSCMECHKAGDKTKLGIGSVCAIHENHTGIKIFPGIRVPLSLLQEGKIGCGSCHDPHRTNSNYKYLIIKTKNGKKIRDLCAICHGKKTKKTKINADQQILKCV